MPLHLSADLTPELRASHRDLRKALFGWGSRAKAKSNAAARQKWHDWHEQYGFHSTDPAGQSIAHASLHLRMAHYHLAHGEHDAAAAHYAAHQAHQAVAAGSKRANVFKAHQLSDAAWRSSTPIHAASARAPTAGMATAAPSSEPHLDGFRHAPGTGTHLQAHRELHFRVAQYHQARGEHAAAEAHWRVAQGEATPAAAERAWAATGAVHPVRAAAPRAGRVRAPKAGTGQAPTPKPHGRIN